MGASGVDADGVEKTSKEEAEVKMSSHDFEEMETNRGNLRWTGGSKAKQEEVEVSRIEQEEVEVSRFEQEEVEVRRLEQEEVEVSRLEQEEEGVSRY